MRLTDNLHLNDFVFDGFPFSEHLVLEEVQRSAIDISNTFADLPGRSGDILLNSKRQARVIDVTCRIIRKRWLDVDAAVSFLSSKLFKDSPKELKLRDSDLVEFVVADRIARLDREHDTGRLRIRFINPSGFRYGPEQRVAFSSGMELDIYTTGTEDAAFDIAGTITAENAEIKRHATGDRLIWENLLVGEDIGIDGSVPVCTGASARRGLMLQSRFFKLRPGSNRISFQGIDGVIRWRDTWT